MDVAILGNALKIRSKNASFVVNPVKAISKVNADAIFVLGNNLEIDTSRVLDHRIIINGPGEYEVGGVKISVVLGAEGLAYNLFLDNTTVVLGKVSDISKLQENIPSCQIALLEVDEDLKSIVAKLEPKIVILYGDKKMDGLKLLGKEGIEPVQKFSTTKGKLPEEMEVVVLG